MLPDKNAEFDMLSDAIVLVLHKVVLSDYVEWEDVQICLLRKIVQHISSRATTFREHGQLGQNRWLLTFDDGNASDYELVFPFLLESNMSATFFVITERIGQPGYLTWSQVDEMWRHGMCIGSHSHSHHRMTDLSSKLAYEEFVVSKKILEDRLGSKIEAFSFPYGAMDNDLYKQGLTAGYTYICNSAHGVVCGKKPLIPRNSINSRMEWSAIKKVLDPNFSTRILWLGEDIAKASFKKLIGHKRYRKFRDSLIN